MEERSESLKSGLFLACLFLFSLFGVARAHAYDFVPYLSPAYTNQVSVRVVQGISSSTVYSYDAPYAEANASIGSSSGTNGRGSDYAISNDYHVDPDGTKTSRVDFSLHGSTEGNLAVSPGFIFTQASSTADYWFMLGGGSGQVQVTAAMAVSDTGKPYPNSPFYAFSVFDNAGNSLFEWEDGELMATFLLALNEPFRISAGSGVNTTRTSRGSFDYESLATFTVEVVQSPDLVPVPLPSTLIFLLSGLLMATCGRDRPLTSV
ncbi:MAG: hypothetical protein AB1512_06760 [Thermodesulfobacteriota bacterium]